MTLRPATWPWLLRHELRLTWRTGASRRRRLVVLALLGAVYAALHAGAWFALRLLPPAGPPPLLLVVGLGAGLFLVFTLMLSQAIAQSVSALYDRGDFDLLLAAPVAPWAVFTVRALAIAVSVSGVYAFLLTPFANVGAFTGHARLLAVYPALAALALLASALGIALTLGLVRALGARRARVVAQLLGAVIGAAMFLLAQAQNLLRDTAVAAHAAAAWAALARSGWLDAASPLWWPAQALLGRPGPLAGLVAVGAGSFALVLRATGRAFLAGTQAASEAATPDAATRTAASARRPRFRTGLVGVVLRKEWKLIGRDPQLIAQTLLQTLYLLPLVFIGPRSHGLSALVVPGIVLASATLASSLGWLAVAAEDAPELIAGAPVSAARVRRLKLLAALLPVWLLVAPALAYAGRDAWTAAVFVACVAGATVSAASIQLLAAKPGSRQNLRRRGKGDGLVTGIELVAAMGWAATAWCALVVPPFAAIPLVPALLAPGAAAVVGRRRRAG